MDTGHMLAMATCEYTLSLIGEMVLRGFWQDQQFLLQEHHLHRCIMVVHVLLRVVVSLVSATTLLDRFSLTASFFKCIRVHLPVVLEFLLDTMPCDCHWLV